MGAWLVSNETRLQARVPFLPSLWPTVPSTFVRKELWDGNTLNRTCCPAELVLGSERKAQVPACSCPGSSGGERGKGMQARLASWVLRKGLKGFMEKEAWEMLTVPSPAKPEVIQSPSALWRG